MAKKKLASWSDDEDREKKDQEHLDAMGTPPPGTPPEGTPEPISKKRIILPRLDLRRIHITLIGDTALISNKWSEKAKRQILAKQMGKATRGKEPKNPDADTEASFYRFPDGRYGFPAIAFKNSAVTACTSLDDVTKVQARQAFHVQGELVEVIGEPSQREDMVKISMGVADIRYRGQFEQWKVTLDVIYNARVLTDEQVVNLFNVAGFAVGVGEWRPERDGQFGRFHVATDE